MGGKHFFNGASENVIRRADSRAHYVLGVKRSEGLSIKDTAIRLKMTYSEVYNLLKRAELRGIE